jgi:hypothetical protein
METIKFRLTAKTPMLMHNGRLADPLDEYTRAIAKVSKIRNKTESDHEELARLEWLGSLYVKGGRVGVPGINLRSAIVGPGGSARQSKKGKEAAKALRMAEFYFMEYDGPSDPSELWNDVNYRHRASVTVGRGSTVIRTRPIFENWTIEGELQYSPDFADRDDVIHWLKVAGNEVGLGDWRPQKYGPYGTFDVEILE